jgi:hypothetical protein
MAGIENDVNQIRQALYGREVREAIAHGIEQCAEKVGTLGTKLIVEDTDGLILNQTDDSD